MRFSVITVCRNAAPVIAETLQSVLGQIGTSVELIVIDGASTDGTRDIVERDHARLAAFVSEPDRSIYEAMNKGIERARGDYLYFLNAGDILASPDTLAQVDRELRGNPELLVGDVWLEDIGGGNGLLKSHAGLDKPHFYRGSVTQQAIFYRRDLFERHGRFNPDLKIVGDHDWLVRALFLHHLPLRYRPLVLCNFRRGGISTSTDMQVKLHHQSERLQTQQAIFTRWELRLLESRKFQKLMNHPRIRQWTWSLLGWNISQG